MLSTGSSETDTGSQDLAIVPLSLDGKLDTADPLEKHTIQFTCLADMTAIKKIVFQDRSCRSAVPTGSNGHVMSFGRTNDRLLLRALGLLMDTN